MQDIVILKVQTKHFTKLIFLLFMTIKEKTEREKLFIFNKQRKWIWKILKKVVMLHIEKKS